MIPNYSGERSQVYRSICGATDDAVPIEILRRFEYDHAGRLLTTYHKIDTEPEITLSSNGYNELSQLIEKNLHANDLTKMQSLDYSYNIRGWLTNINESSLVSTGDTNTDLFGMELGYNTNVPGISGTALFNGNISAMQWSDPTGTGAGATRAYTYGYDKLNRLTAANSEGTGTNAYSVPSLSYDLNGNILNLDRRGETNNAFMDQLGYGYTGNQLQFVDDGSNNSEGFDNGYAGTLLDPDYLYDANGNMTQDLNKGITNIDYNHLNLPERVDFDANNYLLYYYDAAGIKLKQEVYKAGVLETTREYVGEFYYEDGDLKFIQHEEGRIVFKKKAGLDIAWTFDSSTEGFAAVKQISGFQQAAPGHIEGTITGGDPYMRSPNNLNFSALDYPTIRVRLENNTASTQATVFFTTTADVVEGGGKHLFFNIDPNSGYKDYILDMSSVSGWQGTIKRLRLDPAVSATGSFKLDEMVVISNEYEPDYQYSLQDHLGNTRLTFSTTDENYTTPATMDDPTEAAEFGGWNDDEPNGRNGTKALRLNTNDPSGGTFNGVTALRRMLPLDKGDTVKLKAFANYDPAQNTNGNGLIDLVDLFALLTGSYTAAGVSEAVNVGSGSFTDPLVTATVDKGSSPENTDAPAAYLNYMFFDEDMNLTEQAGFEQISSAAEGANWEEISLEMVADHGGFILVYLSNETNAASIVNFDDLTIYHGKTNVVYASSFTPFGLEFQTFTRSLSEKVRFKFQEQEHDEETGWIAFKWRNHDPTIGRFFNVDPLAEDYYYNSPYAFSENHVTGHRELEGLEKLKVAISTFIVNEEKPRRNSDERNESGRGFKNPTGNYNKTVSDAPEGSYNGVEFSYDVSTGESSDFSYTDNNSTWVGQVWDAGVNGHSQYVNNDLESETSESGSNLSGDFDGVEISISFNLEDGTMTISTPGSKGADSGVVIKVDEVGGYGGFSVSNGHLEKSKSINYSVDKDNNVKFDSNQGRQEREKDKKELPINSKKGGS